MEFHRNPSWRWVPVIALILAGVIYILGWNVPLLLLINHAGVYLPTAFWESVTICGNGLFSLSLLTLWISTRPYTAWAGLLSIIPAAAISRGFKMAIDVPRPPAIMPDTVLHVIGPVYRHTSFPSGDALTIFVIAGIAWFTYSNPRIRAVTLAFATLVATSRLVVGVHWPIDVLVGAAAGWMSAWIGVHMAERWKWGATLSGRKFTAGFLLIAAIALFYQDMRLPGATWLRIAFASVATLLAVRSLIWTYGLLRRNELSIKRKDANPIMIMNR